MNDALPIVIITVLDITFWAIIIISLICGWVTAGVIMSVIGLLFSLTCIAFSDT